MSTCPETYQRQGATGHAVGAPVRCLRDPHPPEQMHVGWVLGIGDYTWWTPGYAPPDPRTAAATRSPAAPPPPAKDEAGA